MGRFHYQRCLRFGMAAPPLVAHETYSHLVVVVVVIVVVAAVVVVDVAAQV